MHRLRVEITDYCNRRCAYCFFKDLLKSTKEEVSIEELQILLDYCSKENINSIALQGGEPTTHSQFEKILTILEKEEFEVGLFTNGIFDTKLIERMSCIALTCLLNYNHPESYENVKQWELVNKNIRKMVDKKISVRIAYTLFEKNPDTSFFIEAIRKYKMKNIRWDIARPSGGATNKYFGADSLAKNIPTMVKFMKECLAAGAFPQLDCPLPFCITSRKEFDFMRRFLSFPKAPCKTELNIGPKLRLASCPASVMTENIFLTDFQTLSQAMQFIASVENHLRWNVYSLVECKNCFYRINKLCQGGCVGHKKIKENKTITRKDLGEFLKKEHLTSHDFSKDETTSIDNRQIDYFKTGLAFARLNRPGEAFRMFVQANYDELIEEEKVFVDNFLKEMLGKSKYLTRK